MTITSNLKSKIDSLWLEFHSGGITNPITVIEQISYPMAHIVHALSGMAHRTTRAFAWRWRLARSQKMEANQDLGIVDKWSSCNDSRISHSY